MNPYDEGDYYTKIVLFRQSTNSRMVVDAPRIIDKIETVNGIPFDVWDWIQSEFGQYVGNFVFFSYE